MAIVNQTLEGSAIIGGSSAENLTGRDTQNANVEQTHVNELITQTSDELTAIFREITFENGDILPILGNVTIIGKLGGGNMGIVYLAKRNNPIEGQDDRIVIKLLKKDEDPKIHNELLQRLMLEASTAQAINAIPNKNVAFPQCFGHFTLQKNGEELNYIALEYIPGIDLNTLLTISGKFPLRTVAALALQLAQNLAIFHENGIVHRDVKPDNTMVSDRLFIMDAGLAHRKSEGEQAKEDSLTQAGAALGSPVYISPEAWHDQVGSRDPKRDVYALGITLHQLITGKRPAELATREKYETHFKYRQHIDVVDIAVFPKSEDLLETAFIESFAELIRLMLHPDPALRISMVDVQNYLQEMIILPENKSIKVPIDCSKNTFDPYQVLELLNAAASNIQVRGYSKQISNFDEKTFISREFTNAERIQEVQLSGRSRLKHVFRWGAGGTIVAGVLGTLGYIDHLNSQSNFVDSPIRVVTTHNHIEEPKPTSIDCIKNAEGAISALLLNVHTPDFTTSIELDASNALVMEINDASERGAIENGSETQKQYYLAFWCNTEQKIAAAKIIYAGKDEPMPDAQNLQGMLLSFILKDGTLLFQFPNIGIIVQREDEIQTYTVKDIKEGRLIIDHSTLDQIANIQPGRLIQEMPKNILIEHQLPDSFGEKLKDVPQIQPNILIQAATRTITPVSATSN